MRTMLALAAMMGALFLIFVRAAHDKATAPRTRLAYSPRAPPAPKNASRPAWCGRPEACDRWQPALGQRLQQGLRVVGHTHSTALAADAYGRVVRPTARGAEEPARRRSTATSSAAPRRLDWRARPLPRAVLAAAAAAAAAEASGRLEPAPPARRGCDLATDDSAVVFFHVPKAGGGFVRQLLACAAIYAKGSVCNGCVRTLNELGCNASSADGVARCGARVRGGPTARRTRRRTRARSSPTTTTSAPSSRSRSRRAAPRARSSA